MGIRTGSRWFVNALKNQIDSAQAAASTAEATGQNARQMVINRDATIAAQQQSINNLQTIINGMPVPVNYATQIAALQSAVANIPAPINYETRIAALEALLSAQPKMSMGSSIVSAAIAAGATRDVVVTLQMPMPTDTYQAGAWIGGATSILGQTLVTGIVAKTKTTVTVQVKNTGLTGLLASAISVQVLVLG